MLIQHPAVLSENMVSLYFFLSPQRCRISHRRQCASLLHWNLTIPPSLWPDRELRKYHCPCLALTPPPVAIRHLLLRNRYRPDGLHGVQSKARPNRNVPEEWVFSFQGTSGLSSLQSKFNKNPPVSRWPRRRTLVVLVGPPAARSNLFSVLFSLIEAKKYPVGFPTRHQRRFYSVFCKLLFIFPGDHLSHGQCIKVLVLWCRAFSWFSSSKNSFSVFILWLLLGQVNRILTDTPLSVQISILKCLVHCF